MKILQLINRMPYPLNDGGSIGIHFYIEGFLNAGISLSVLAMNTTRHWVDGKELPKMYDRLDYFKAVKVDNSIKPLDAFLNLFQNSSYNIDRFISKAYEGELTSLLKKERFDIIQLESLFVTPYIPLIKKYSNAKIVIRQHNIEFKIWERLALKEKSLLKRQYLKLLARRLKKHEIKFLNEYDLLLPISKNDAAILKSLNVQKPLFIHPFGINLKKAPYAGFDEKSAISLYHIGAMDWLPNQESVHYFLENVMPELNKQLPHLKLYLAGRNMPQYFFDQSWPNVEVVGEVKDARLFEKDKSILIVPLLSGGGVRIKIFNAMAMGKAIVTTPVGVEGITAEDGKHIMIAKTPGEFVEKIIDLVRNPHKIKQMGEAARQLMEAKYNQEELIGNLLSKYNTLINGT